MYYISSFVYFFSAGAGLFFGFKNFQAFKRTHNWYSKMWAVAITAFALGLLSFGFASFGQSQTIYKIALIIGYIFLFVGFDYSFQTSFKYLNLEKVAVIVRIIFLLWIVPIIILYSLNFANPILDKYGFVFWNYKFPLNWIAFSYVFFAALINFLVYLKAVRDCQDILEKLRSLFIALAFFFAGCGGAFTSLTNPGNYYSIFIAYSGMFLGFLSLLLAIYYKRGKLERKKPPHFNWAAKKESK